MTATIPVPSARRKRYTRKQIVARLAVGVMIVGLLGMWVYAFGFATKTGAAELSDTAWTTRAEAICKTRDAQLDANVATYSSTAGGTTELGVTIKRSTDIIEAALNQVVAVRPASAVDQRLVATWEGLYRTYIADRREAEAKLINGQKAELNETVLNGSPISDTIADFTSPNHMPSCAVPPGI